MRSFVIRCQKMDLALATQLMADLPVQGPLVGFDRQEEVGPLLCGLLKNGCCVWRASAWISTPSSEGPAMASPILVQRETPVWPSSWLW